MTTTWPCCGRPLDRPGCEQLYYDHNGVRFERIPYDDEGGRFPPQCNDCDAPVGGYHHRWCDQDTCAHGQALTCVRCDLVLADGTHVMAGQIDVIAGAIADGWRP